MFPIGVATVDLLPPSHPVPNPQNVLLHYIRDPHSFPGSFIFKIPCPLYPRSLLSTRLNSFSLAFLICLQSIQFYLLSGKSKQQLPEGALYWKAKTPQRSQRIAPA